MKRMIYGTVLLLCIFEGTAKDWTFGRYGDMLHEYYIGKNAEVALHRRDHLGGLRTREDALRHIREVRSCLRRSFGAFPERTPLAARVVKRTETSRCRIEAVIFESRPGLEVTADFYCGKNISGKMPGVLLLLGHNDSGKFRYQDVAQRLAMAGYAVLAADPIGQGERHQFEAGQDGIRGCCDEHNMLGKKLQLLGENLSLWRLWDAVRALDYLLSRPEVDTRHVGVTGCSGGGTLTAFLNAFDPRLTMAAPCCSVTTLQRNLENELPTDSEQNPPCFQALGLDTADFFVAAAPRPVVFLVQDNDFFDCRGAVEVYQEVKKIYALLGKPDAVRLIMGEGMHGYPVHHQYNMIQFFNDCSGLKNTLREEPEKLTHEQLDCYASGQKRGRTVQDLLNGMLAGMPSRQKLTPEELSCRARMVLKLETGIPVPDYRVYRTGIHELHQEDLEKETYFNRFALKTEPGIIVMLKHLTKRQILFQPCRLPERVTLFVPHLSASEEMPGLGLTADSRQAVFVCEVRGIGETRPAESSTFIRDFFTGYGIDFMYACSGLMLNQPVLGRRVFDLLSAVKFLAANGVAKIDLIGNGQNAVTAALAALFASEIDTVTLRNAPESYASMVRRRVTGWPSAMMPYGILRHFDLPELYRAVRARVESTAADPSLVSAQTKQRRCLVE